MHWAVAARAQHTAQHLALMRLLPVLLGPCFSGQSSASAGSTSGRSPDKDADTEFRVSAAVLPIWAKIMCRPSIADRMSFCMQGRWCAAPAASCTPARQGAAAGKRPAPAGGDSSGTQAAAHGTAALTVEGTCDSAEVAAVADVAGAGCGIPSPICHCLYTARPMQWAGLRALRIQMHTCYESYSLPARAGAQSQACNGWKPTPSTCRPQTDLAGCCRLLLCCPDASPCQLLSQTAAALSGGNGARTGLGSLVSQDSPAAQHQRSLARRTAGPWTGKCSW